MPSIFLFKIAVSLVLVLAFVFLCLLCIDGALVLSGDAVTSRSMAVVAVKDSQNQNKTIKILPPFENGGVIFNLHIPKTGGTTIRKHFQRRENVKYIFSTNAATFDKHLQTMNKWVQNGPEKNKIGIFELHARNNPTLLDVCHLLKTWRATARENNVQFFAFTMLREPTAFAISYFNYYHGKRWEKRRFEFLPEVNMTEDNFLRTMHFNPQCLFLARSEQAYQRNFPEKRKKLTKVECDTAFECLRTNMDWVGTTESLRNETIPLLDSIINSGLNSSNNTERQEKRVKDENFSQKFFTLKDAKKSTLDFLENMTQWDREMYARISNEYSIWDYGILRRTWKRSN